jgi:hypothetical protein
MRTARRLLLLAAANVPVKGLIGGTEALAQCGRGYHHRHGYSRGYRFGYGYGSYRPGYYGYAAPRGGYYGYGGYRGWASDYPDPYAYGYGPGTEAITARVITEDRASATRATTGIAAESSRAGATRRRKRSG